MTSGARTIGSLSWQQNWLLGQIWSGIKRELETSSELPVALSRTLSVLSIRDIKRRCLNPTWMWTTLTVVRVLGFRPRCIVLTFARQVIELQDVGGGPRVTEKKSLKDLRSLSKDIGTDWARECLAAWLRLPHRQSFLRSQQNKALRFFPNECFARMLQMTSTCFRQPFCFLIQHYFWCSHHLLIHI